MEKISVGGDVDWEKTRVTLVEIQNINPVFTSDNCVIGGSAASFYRTPGETIEFLTTDFRLAEEIVGVDFTYCVPR